MSIKVYRDGRTKLTGKDYTDHKRRVWEAQAHRCAECGLYVPISDCHFDHFTGRGMSGGKRDDLDERNEILHPVCHSARHYRNRDLYAKTHKNAEIEP